MIAWCLPCRLLCLWTCPLTLDPAVSVGRYFYTKTCTVEPACQDTSDARMEDMGMEVTCAEIKGRCDASDSEDATFFPYLCPVACGVCAAAPEDSEPAGYVVDAIRYHGHLLGREMYRGDPRGKGRQGKRLGVR